MLNIYTNFCYLRRRFCFFILSPTTQPSSSFFSFFLFSFLVSCLFFYSLNGLTSHDWRKLYNGRDVGICRVIYYKKLLHVKTEERRECMFFARIFLLTGFRAQPAIFPKLQKVAAPCGPILTTHSDTSGTVVRPTFHLAFRPSSYDFLLAIRRAGNRYGSCERFKVSRRQTIELCSWSPLYRCVRSFSFL